MMEQEFSTNFEYYKVFYYTAKYRNITLAAQKLFLTQPSVTKAIQRLEEQLDCQLFLRTKRGVTLTAEGQTCLLYTSWGWAVRFQRDLTRWCLTNCLPFGRTAA